MKNVGRGEERSFSDRQRRRAALYRRREKQLFRRKVGAVFVVFSLLATLIAARVFVYRHEGDTRDLLSAAKDVLPRATASAGNLSDGDPMGKVASTASMENGIGAQVAAQTAVLQAAPDLAAGALYTPAVTLDASADAASFFNGYQPFTTNRTAFLPENPSSQNAAYTGEQTQGASDYEDDFEPASSEDVFLDSENAVLINLDTGEVVAARNPDVAIYPASMTKIMTLLVANEQLTDRDATFTITQDITDLTFSESLSSVCWNVGETVTVADLEYGTILPSGADAAIGLSRLAAGSEDALVDLMNDKAQAMGLSQVAHFSNVTGMFEEENRCTVTDMAMIMKAAVEYAHVLDVLQTREYTTSKTAEHPNGVYMFNLFLDRSDLREMTGTLVCAKTGYTIEALNCAASYFVSDSGAHYVCVTARGHGSRRVVTDHVNLYNAYAK